MYPNCLIAEVFIPLFFLSLEIEVLLIFWDFFPLDFLVELLDGASRSSAFDHKGLVHSIIQRVLDITFGDSFKILCILLSR